MIRKKMLRADSIKTAELMAEVRESIQQGASDEEELMLEPVEPTLMV